ncbi:PLASMODESMATA CALLOSE-BINDING PROTEIN 3 [Cardamine amara subsp. amara]|uniref:PLASMODESMATA CALLOSE-BINDING PROTEIN 3 n=1 Tax=Cardamine amara subsp. amara TaxID=228776 RepID=A0ABD1BS69_CARAN
MRVLLGLLLLLALITSSSAIYCLCNDGIGDKELQTSIDYACGTLADCTPIKDKGSCFQPNTIKSHCDWAVNSYFQNAVQSPGSCNFTGTATISQNPPSNLVSGCIYPSSPSSTRSPPSTTPPTGTTPTNGTTPFPGTPFPGTPFPGTPPAFGPTGVFNPGNGASSLVISSVFTLCFSSLAFLLISDVRLGFCHV